MKWIFVDIKITIIIIFRVSSRDNSAFAGIDYDRVTNYEVTFVNGGATIQSFTVNITDDSLLEGTESFFLDVSSSVSNIRIGDRASTMIRIIDEDSKLSIVPTLQ